LLLLADSTNIEREGYTMSERTVGATFDELFAANSEKRIIVATFASNVHRLQQILDVSAKYNRKVAFPGRSMLNVLEAATKIGELKYEKSLLVDIDKISNIEDKKLTYYINGQSGRAYERAYPHGVGLIQQGQYRQRRHNNNFRLPNTGNERMIYSVINNLYKKGAEVIYSLLEKVHVSGHACQEEAKIIHTLLKT
jgi:ribonuclease J